MAASAWGRPLFLMSVTKILLALDRHYLWYQSFSGSISVVAFYGKVKSWRHYLF
jgi:hypothetical protein